jgi:hypothetical protein
VPEDMKLGHRVWVNLLADFRVNRVPPTPKLSIQIALQRAEQVGQLLPIAIIGATCSSISGSPAAGNGASIDYACRHPPYRRAGPDRGNVATEAAVNLPARVGQLFRVAYSCVSRRGRVHGFDGLIPAFP